MPQEYPTGYPQYHIPPPPYHLHALLLQVPPHLLLAIPLDKTMGLVIAKRRDQLLVYLCLRQHLLRHSLLHPRLRMKHGQEKRPGYSELRTSNF
jgi:hypothetical protein